MENDKKKKNNYFAKKWRDPNLKYKIAPLLFIVVFIYSILNSYETNILSRVNLIILDIIKFGAPLCIMAIGVSLVIATGGIDISSSGVATLCGILLALFIRLGMPETFSVIMVISIGLFSGFVLGLCITKAGSPPMVLSWAWGLFLYTIAIQFCAGRIIFIENASVTSIRTQNIVSISESSSLQWLYFLLGGIIVFLWYTNYTGITKRACAVGANRDSAIYAGIRVDKTVIWAYVFSGLCASLAGIIWFYINQKAGSTEIFYGAELTPIAIALIGGTSLSGGYLNLWSVMIASLFWANLELIVNNYPTHQTDVNWQHQLLTIVFCIIIIFISTVLGKKLKGDTITIHAEQKTKNE